MEYIDEEIKVLIEDINYMKRGSIGEMFLIIYYSLISYLKCLLVFGHKSKITKDSINVIKEMFNILKLEKKMLNYILKNINHFDVNATIKVILMLDELNANTVRYYYDVIDDIEIAADMNNEFRGLRPSTPLPTLIQTNLYTLEVIALGENFGSLKSFLGFENEFWDYIQNKVEIITDELNDTGFVEPIVDNNVIIGINLRVPKITNLQTALWTLKAYKRAYELYTMIGCRYDTNKIDDDKDLQKKYCEEYLLKKAKDQFKLKNVM